VPNIHPTAIVEEGVRLAENVEVGPFCVLRGAITIGAGTRLVGNVYIDGRVLMGKHNTVYPFATIGFPPQDLKFGGTTAGVQIGDRNVLREGVTIHCATTSERPTTIGNDNMLMTNSHLGHDASVGNECVLVSGVLIGGHAEIGNQVTMGGNAALHQFCRIGRLSMIGGTEPMTKDIPPFSLAAARNTASGVNVIGLRRSGVERAAIDEMRRAFRTLYMQGHTNPVAASMIDKRAESGVPGSELLFELTDFIRSSKRGLIAHRAQVAVGGPVG